MIYFVQAGEGGPIKIGTTEGMMNLRLSYMQASSPQQLSLLASCAGDIDHEKALHLKFSSLRIRGEWFEACHELLEFCASIGINSDHVPLRRPVKVKRATVDLSPKLRKWIAAKADRNRRTISSEIKMLLQETMEAERAH